MESFILDVKTFEKAYRMHWRMVFGVCYKYLHDKEIAMELVQDIFESVWRRQTIEINGSVEGYLAGAARLAVFNYIRKTKKEPEFCSVQESELHIAVTNTEDEILYNDLCERVGELTGHLPEKSREVFHMSRNQGLSNKEIAVALLISENTVKYHIGYATRFLKAELKEFS